MSRNLTLHQKIHSILKVLRSKAKSSPMGYTRFTDMITTQKVRANTGAGFLILNPSLTKILLVKGREAGKWGPPKGHPEKQETELDTAISEGYQETGCKFTFRMPILPHVISNGIKLYCVVVPEATRLEVQDKKEIEAIMWGELSDLKDMISTHPEMFNGCLRGLYKKCAMIETAKAKIRAFRHNYPKNITHPFNEPLYRLRHKLHKLVAFDTTLTELETQYIYFTVIQTMYRNIFSYSDLLQFVQKNF